MIPNSLRHALFVAAIASFAAPAWAESAYMIVIKNFDFTPMSLTVPAGTTVTWKNLDGEPHTVVSDTGLYRSAALDQDGTFAFTFAKPGIYKYTCSIHPKMTGTIVVQ